MTQAKAKIMRSDPALLCASGLEVIRTEARAITALEERVDAVFAHACQIMLDCVGRIVVIGMGKSGHIGRKIAATLASAGSPAFFVHPGEASHGDMGMITNEDVVLALSNSGETEEILTILPLIKRLGIPFITLTGNPDSHLAHAADVNVDVSVEQEACPLGLAPTASTSAALAMGDAMSIALLEARGFGAEDFARSHPGGRLGRRLLLHVGDIMRQGDEVPQVSAEAYVGDALMEMTRKSLGMTAVVDSRSRVMGIYTDGDVRRTLDNEVDIKNTPILEVMTSNCVTIPQEMLAAEAVNIMQRKAIFVLLVVTPEQQLIGVLHMHDLLRAGVL